MSTKFKLFYIAVGIWTSLAILFLIMGMTKGEARMGSGILMTIIGFPSNLFIPDALIRLFPEFGKDFYNVNGPIWRYLLDWFLLYLIGALQWFVIPHLIWRKWFKRKG